MKIQIVSIGKLSSEIGKLFTNYQKIIGWEIKNSEITYGRKLLPNQIKQYEARLIEGKLNKDSCIISLDLSGEQYSSENFSKIFSQLMMQGKNIDFIIGGAFGIDKSILNKSDKKLCLSKMTLPHQLAKLFLIEQIYRSQTILNGHPYHK